MLRYIGEFKMITKSFSMSPDLIAKVVGTVGSPLIVISELIKNAVDVFQFFFVVTFGFNGNKCFHKILIIFFLQLQKLIFHFCKFHVRHLHNFCFGDRSIDRIMKDRKSKVLINIFHMVLYQN